MTKQISEDIQTYLEVPRAIKAINRDGRQARALATLGSSTAAARILRNDAAANGRIPNASQAIAALNSARTQARNRLNAAGVLTL